MSTPAVAAPAPRARREFSQEQIALLIVAGLFVVFSFALHGFLTSDNLLTLARNVSSLGILAVGMAVVVIARGLDLSLIATMGVATALTVQLMNHGAATPVALAVGLAVALAMGMANGLLIAFVEIPPLFTTLASGLFVYGLARVAVLDGLIADVPSDRHALLYLGQGTPLGIPMPLIIFAAVALGVHLILSRTVLGRFIYAHGDNSEAAALTGLGVRPLTVAEYTLAALIGFIAGLVMAGAVSGFNTQVISSSLIYDVLLVVVVGGISLVGGRGSIGSVVAGTALIGLLLDGMTILDLNVHQQNIAKGLVLLAALVLDNRLHPRDEETVRQGD